jgi:membrane associated rhomboid family serine protease
MLSRRSPGRPATGREAAAPERPPLVTYTLIGLCVLAFLIGPASGLDPLYGAGHDRVCAQAGYFARWGAIPSQLWHGTPPPGALLPAGCPPAGTRGAFPPLSVLTALFVHGGWTHLVGNMLFLFVFGPAVEDRMGRARYAVFYLVGGYAATYGYAFEAAGSGQPLIGASGAIAAVLGAFLFLCPRTRVTIVLPFLLFLPLRFPAWLVLGSWFAVQWFASRAAAAEPGVAYLAHVIGFAFGFLCAAAAYRAGPKLAPQAATRGDSQP